MAGPLTGVKVLDLSRVLAGPWATQVLADFGAEVIKVERPRQGDDTRHWGPPYLKDKEGRNSEEAAYYLSANRGKKSIAVDFTQAEGQEIIRQLASKSDVIVENFKVGGLKKYNLDYDSIKSVNPGIIYCSITGFGQTGPYASRAGYDAIIQGMGGLMSITGEMDDLPGGGPQKVGVAVSDLMTGMYSVSAITAALFHREKTGEGQFIDLALLDTQVAWLANQNMNWLVGGEVPKRRGTAHPNIVPYQAVPAKDGHFMLAVGNDDQFRRFCDVIERQDLADAEQYATNKARVENRVLLLEEITKALSKQDSHFWISALEERHVPCAPINDIQQVFKDPQVKAREMMFELPHAISGTVKQVANPVKYSATSVEYHSAPPLLGEHSIEILSQLGYDETAIQNLMGKGVVG